MSILFRLMLFFISMGALVFVLRRIRKSQVQIENAVFWILLMMLFVIVSVFPNIVISLSDWIGIESPANFVFLCIIFLLLLKVFHLSLHISKQQYQIQQLAQIVALENLRKNNEENVRNEEMQDE